MLVKDNEWAEHVAYEARLFFSREGFAQYLQSLKREREARHGNVRDR